MSRSLPAVLWVVPNYPWGGDQVGGIFYRNQATALVRAGVDVMVIAPTPAVPWPLSHLSRRWDRYRRAPTIQSDDGVSIARPRYPTAPRDARALRPDRRMASAIWRIRSRWKDHADVIHGHFSLTGIAAGLVARRAALPYVLTVHGDDINTWPRERPEWRQSWIEALRGAATVVAVSGALADRVREFAGVEARTLPLGIRLSEFRAAAMADRATIRGQFGIEDDAFVALFVGNLLIPKGIVEFVEGVRLAGASVVGLVVGSGPQRRPLEAREGGRIRWLGSMPNQAVARTMAAADVLVLPSHAEGLPTVIVEAGSVGLPVIASRVGGIPRLLAEGRGLLLEEISGDAVASALRRVAAAPQIARRWGEALRTHVEEVYDVDSNAMRLATVYADIAATVRRPRASR